MGYYCRMSTDTNKALIDRLSRAEGQIKALKRTLEEGEAVDCKNFIAQVKAARSALRAVNDQFIMSHISSCQSLPPAERDAQMQEAIKLLASD